MKFLSKIILIVSSLILFVCIQSCKKEVALDNPDNQYLQYKPYGLNEIRDLHISKTGEIFLIGAFQNQMFFLKTNHEGGLIWKKEIPFQVQSLYYTNTIIEEANGNFILIGDKNIQYESDDICILKLNREGDIIKETLFSNFKRDTVSNGIIYGNYYDGYYSKDANDGYFLQISMRSLSSFSIGYEKLILHYNAYDSFDFCSNLVGMDINFSNSSVEIANNAGNQFNILRFNNNTGEYFIEQLDGQDLVKNKATIKWTTPIQIIGEQQVAYADNDYIYNCQIKFDLLKEYSQGIFITKLDSKTGTIIKQWLVPLVVKNTFNSLYITTKIAADDEALYITLSNDKSSYVIKALKNETVGWINEFGGNISRNLVDHLKVDNSQIILTGFSTLNRSREFVFFMCRLNKKGEYLIK